MSTTPEQSAERYAARRRQVDALAKEARRFATSLELDDPGARTSKDVVVLLRAMASMVDGLDHDLNNARTVVRNYNDVVPVLRKRLAALTELLNDCVSRLDPDVDGALCRDIVKELSAP